MHVRLYFDNKVTVVFNFRNNMNSGLNKIKNMNKIVILKNLSNFKVNHHNHQIEQIVIFNYMGKLLVSNKNDIKLLLIILIYWSLF